MNAIPSQHFRALMVDLSPADGLIFACFAAFLLAGLFSLIKGGEIASLGAALFGV